MSTDDVSARSVRVCVATWVAIVGATLCAGCGAGTAAAISGGGGGGGGNAPPSMSGLSVLDPEVPHLARVRFVLTDVEGDPAQVELFYQAPGAPRRPMTQVGANPLMLATSRDGKEHQLPWNFAAEAELPADAHFVHGVRVIASVQNGLQEVVLGANDDFGLGNDAPVVSDALPPAPEVDGVVPVRFTVSDSSDDFVSIKVEFDIAGDDPDLGWRIARPGGLLLHEPTPELAFPAIEAPASGASFFFFWNTDIDLAELERDVKLRFTAEDPVIIGDAHETPVFRVDNNEEPIATIGEGGLLLNPDQRAGIPIPYTVRDEESDEVEVVFQWRLPDESFPELPDTAEEIRAIVADPDQRRALHICTEYPTWVEGRVVPIDSTHVRLPELATSAASILAHGVVGRELEILRASKVPKPIAATWAQNPLNHPVAALPVGDGIEALVLDRASSGNWRLRQIDLATGVVTRELVPSAAGEPGAMAFERDERGVLVASDVGGAWQVSRVTLADGSLTGLIAFDGTTESGAVRGLASESANSALITLGSSLIRLDYADVQSPRAITLFDDLATPWGVALDPRQPHRVYVAEHDAPSTVSDLGRVLVIDLDRRERRPLTFGAVDPSEAVVPAPEGLAFDRRFDRLLVVQQLPLADPSVLAIDVGSSSASAFSPESSAFSGNAAGIATGSDRMIVLALPSNDELAVGGGIEQRRIIDDLDLAPQIVHLTEAFSPAPSAFQPCRIRRPSVSQRGSPSGVRRTFVWDSTEGATAAAGVLLRAVPMDAERGVEGDTETAKAIRSTLDTEPVALGDSSVTNGPVSVAAADLDGDGDLDLASANESSNTLTIFFQSSPGVFGSTPLSLGNSSVTDYPSSVAAADLDGDGDLDLASANYLGDTLTVFFQTTPGVFGSTPLSLGNSSVTDGPFSVTAADLDGDGDLDLASANVFSDTLTVFFQTTPGVFGSTPLSLGNLSVTDGPQSVAAADLDGDGDLDLASANGSSSTLTVFFQTSPGDFGSSPLSLGNSSVTYAPVSVTAADLDGDGDLDLASANRVSNTLTVFFQTSPGVFGSTPLSLANASAAFQPLSVAAADLDGDGDLDLASANIDSDTLTVFFQTSPGVFDSTPIWLGDLSVMNGPRSVAAADLDGDGDLDLASANQFSDTLTVFFQTSPGVFGSTPISLGNSSVTYQPWFVTAADLDGDGDLDLASANTGSTLTVFFQTSPGVFGSTPISLGNAAVTAGPVSVAAADLDGDGDLDLASANQFSDTLTIFWNNHLPHTA